MRWLRRRSARRRACYASASSSRPVVSTLAAEACAPLRRLQPSRPDTAVNFLPEPAPAQDAAGRSAVLLVNLGTPQAPAAGPVRRYLREFLSDPRVVELPRALWLPILHGIVLTTRPAKSAAKYATVWTEQGSPLAHWSQAQARLLRERCAAGGLDVDVVLAMRYGEPSVARVLAELRARRCERLLVLPMYPQYSASTTATVFDAVHVELMRVRNVPEVRWVKHFHDQPAYIHALAQRVRDHWLAQGSAPAHGGKLVISFHGVPRRSVEAGDPYQRQCLRTGHLLAQALDLKQDDYAVSFQSRFGREEWLQPYTAPLLAELGRAKTPRVDVICPGFVADCLETLEEIGIEGRQEFQRAGGGEYHHIACLNDTPAFIDALAALVAQHSQGWPVADPARRQAPAVQAAERAEGAGT